LFDALLDGRNHAEKRLVQGALLFKSRSDHGTSRASTHHALEHG